MFLKNILKTKKLLKKTFAFPKFLGMFDENNERAAVCYNYFIKDGVLTGGIGFSVPVLPISYDSDITRTITVDSSEKCDLWFAPSYNAGAGSRVDRLLWSNPDGKLGYIDIVGLSKLGISVETDFGEPPTGITYAHGDTDYVVFSVDGKLGSFSSVGFESQTTTLPKFVDLCYAYDRLFGVVEGRRNKILFSENLNPMEWNAEENYITLDDEQGACNRLLMLEDDLFVFRDFGITRIRQFLTNDDVEVFSVFTNKSKIYGKTVVRCGSSILFLTRSGLFRFSSGRVKRLALNLNDHIKEIDNKNATACFDGENYLLALKINFGDDVLVGCEGFEDGCLNNAIIVYNVFTEEINVVRGVDLRSMVKVSSDGIEKVFATFNGEYSSQIGMLDFSGNIFGVALEKVWRSKVQELGVFSKVKKIRKIFMRATNGATVFLETEKERQGFVIGASPSVQEVKTFVCGRGVCLEVCGGVSSKIYPPKILFEEEK